MEYKEIRIKPEHTNKYIEVEEKDLIEIKVRDDGKIYIGGYYLQIRNGEEFAGRAIYLPQCYDYALGEDKSGNKILVPTKIRVY